MKKILFITGLLLVLACNLNTMNNTEPIKYGVTFTAARGYPAQVHAGFLLDSADAFVGGVPREQADESWYYDGTTGSGAQGIPSYIELIYVAYAEKKFYKLQTALPADTILHLFKQGFITYDSMKDVSADETQPAHPDGPWQHTTYNNLNIGVAPGGVVVLWLTGLFHRTEIGRYQATETFVDVNDFYRNPHERTQQEFYDHFYNITVPDEVKQLIATQGMPFGLWDRYRQKFNYRVVLDSYLEDDYIESILLRSYNGEVKYIVNNQDPPIHQLDAVPFRMTVGFLKNTLESEFNDIEVLEAFEQLHKEFPNEPIDLVLQPGLNYANFKAFVRCKNKSIELTKAELKSYVY